MIAEARSLASTGAECAVAHVYIAPAKNRVGHSGFEAPSRNRDLDRHFYLIEDPSLELFRLCQEGATRPILYRAYCCSSGNCTAVNTYQRWSGAGRV